MKIGNIVFKNNLILAPMAGVTDVAFRTLCVRLGADCGVSELISAAALCYDNQKTLNLMATHPEEKIKIIQLFGNDVDIMARACALPALDKYDIIDLNMGCPTPKITSTGKGAALMLDIDKARQIIEACVRATNKPITVKFRKGWDNDHINCVEFAKMCEQAGAKAITVHGRTRDQFYSGTADWDIIAKVKKAVNIPVIASGDVVDLDSYNAIIKATNCDAVMVGRASLGNPQIFAEITGQSTEYSFNYFAREHVNILRQFYPEEFIVGHMRKHFLWYIKGIWGANKYKIELSTSLDINKSLDLIDKLYSQSKR